MRQNLPLRPFQRLALVLRWNRAGVTECLCHKVAQDLSIGIYIYIWRVEEGKRRPIQCMSATWGDVLSKRHTMPLAVTVIEPTVYSTK
jgi:hypothetical protein